MAGDHRFLVLGPIEVRTPAGTPIDLGGPQARLVLARLILAAGLPVSTEALVDAVWGGAPPASAVGTLQTYVSRLRRALGPVAAGCLRYGGGGYVLDVAPADVDAQQFENLVTAGGAALAEGDDTTAVRTLRTALALWRGPALADVDFSAAAAAVARWEELRSGAEEDLYEAELRSGRPAAVIADLTDAVGREPLRDRRRGLLALALYRSDRQADALAVLDDGRRLLAEELGLDPSRALRELRRAILAEDPVLDLAATAAPAPSSSSAAAAPAPAAPAATAPVERDPNDRASDLVGRVGEVRTLREALDGAMAGHGARCVIIEGEPGIGKTRLAAEARALAAARGAATLSAGTLETGAAPAYGPWLELFRAGGHRLDAGGGDSPTAVTVRMFGGEQPLVGTLPVAVSHAIADDVGRAAVQLAEPSGLVLVLEDVQWADPASLELLGNLLPRLGTARVLLLVTVRTLDVGRGDAVVEALAQLTRQPGTRRVTLRGLTRQQSAQLLRLTVSDALTDDVVTEVHARSEGNPFFTTELARMIGEGGLDAAAVGAVVPSGVRDVLQRRVARLPEQTGRVLEVAAVLGRQVDLGLLVRVADLPFDDVLDALEPAFVSRMLEIPAAAPGAVRFTHALVRETLADNTSSLRRARLHLRAAEGISATAGENDDSLEIIAEHLWHAVAVGAGTRAAATLEAAAQVALKRQALVSAESLLLRAATLHRAAGTEGGLAELRVLRQLGFVGAALHGYAVNADSELNRRARELARSTDRLDIALDLIWAEWAGCDTGGQPQRAMRLVDEAEQLVHEVEDPLLLAAVASMRGFSERHVGRMGSAHAHILEALEAFARAPATQEAGFYLNGFLTSVGFRHWTSALHHGLDRDALEQDYQSQQLPFARLVIALFGSAATLAAGDEDGLRVFSRRMTEADPDLMLSFWSAAAEMYTAVSMLQRGEIEAGLTVLGSGEQHLQQAGGRTMLAGIYAGAADALRRHGRTPQARVFVVKARRELAETLELAYLPSVELAEAHLLLAEGDARAAAAAFDRAAAVAIEHESHGMAARVARERAATPPSQTAG